VFPLLDRAEIAAPAQRPAAQFGEVVANTYWPDDRRSRAA